MKVATFKVGLAWTLGFLVLVSGALPEQNVGLEARSVLPETSWNDLGPLPFGGSPNPEEKDEIPNPIPQDSATLAMIYTASTKHGEPHAHYQIYSKAIPDFQAQIKPTTGHMCTLSRWPLSAI